MLSNNNANYYNFFFNFVHDFMQALIFAKHLIFII